MGPVGCSATLNTSSENIFTKSTVLHSRVELLCSKQTLLKQAHEASWVQQTPPLRTSSPPALSCIAGTELLCSEEMHRGTIMTLSHLVRFLALLDYLGGVQCGAAPSLVSSSVLHSSVQLLCSKQTYRRQMQSGKQQDHGVDLYRAVTRMS